MYCLRLIRYEYYEWMVEEVYLCREVSAGGCGGSYRTACLKLAMAIIRCDLRSVCFKLGHFWTFLSTQWYLEVHERLLFCCRLNDNGGAKCLCEGVPRRANNRQSLFVLLQVRAIPLLYCSFKISALFCTTILSFLVKYLHICQLLCSDALHAWYNTLQKVAAGLNVFFRPSATVSRIGLMD